MKFPRLYRFKISFRVRLLLLRLGLKISNKKNRLFQIIYKSLIKLIYILNNHFRLFYRIRFSMKLISWRGCRLEDISSHLFKLHRMKKLKNFFILLRNLLKGERGIRVVMIMLHFKNFVKEIKKGSMNY